MTKNRLPLILIYGNSPQLNRVERTLRADPDVRVIHIDPDGPSAADQVAVLREGVLLYDPATTDPALIQALRTLHPEMGVVGVGETAGRMLSSTRRTGRTRSPLPSTPWAGALCGGRSLGRQTSGLPYLGEQSDISEGVDTPASPGAER